MRKRIIEAIILSLMTVSISFASLGQKQEPINKNAVIITNPMITIDMPTYQQEDVTIEAKHEFIVKETVTVEPLYYVDVVDGYISEDSLKSICRYVGSQYDIQPELLQAIAFTESRYKVDALGSSNDKGLCQIVEKWHTGRMTALGITDIYDPYSNILLCADIISELQTCKYGYDMQFVLMAYNMGENTATRHYESGVISEYAMNVTRKFQELKSSN